MVEELPMTCPHDLITEDGYGDLVCGKCGWHPPARYVETVMEMFERPSRIDGYDHAFEPGVNSDGEPPNPAWCNVCGVRHNDGSDNG
jgi:hypothetical protein